MAASEEPTTELALDEFFSRLIVELDLISDNAVTLECAVARTLIDTENTDSRMLVTELQRFDLLIQSLAALSGFLRAISPEFKNAPSIPLAGALESLPLGDMAVRIKGHQTAVQDDKDAPTGFPDLF